MERVMNVLAAMLVLLVCGVAARAGQHPVPKDRAALKDRDWLPHVISKVAPLEWWSFVQTPADVRRENFPSDTEYDSGRQGDTGFPRFCFALFRPTPGMLDSFTAAVMEYTGKVAWTLSDNCLLALPRPPAVVLPPAMRREQRKSQPSLQDTAKKEAAFLKLAMRDAPKFAAYLEDRLELREKPALDFDAQWLTRDLLAGMPAQFEEYVEPGTWSVYLALKPKEYAENGEPTSSRDRSLSMGIQAYQHEILFRELGVNWDAELPDPATTPLLPDYPLLSRMYEMSEDAMYEPDEVDGLLAEYVRAQGVVKAPESIRGLDNLVRIARWAQKLQLGIYFGGAGP